jgi:ribonuclease R
MNVRIVNHLTNKDLSKKELLKLLNIKSDTEHQMFYRIISKLIKHDTVAMKDGKYHLVKNPFITEGIFSLTKDGYGFIDTEKESYFVNEHNTLGAMTGDKVKYSVIRKERGGRKSEAQVLKILEKKIQNIVGEIIASDSKDELFKFKPYSFVNYQYKVSHKMNLTIGDVVAGEVKGIKNNVLQLEIIDIIGQTGDSDIDIKQVIFEKGIPTEFSDATLKQVKNIEID